MRSSNSSINSAFGSSIGVDGATFIPNVDGEGNLSWTNESGLPNPPPVNIRGPEGEKGEKGDKGEIGPEGKQGLQGEKGKDGQPFTYDMFTPE